jgi:hypothetical protein
MLHLICWACPESQIRTIFRVEMIAKKTKFYEITKICQFAVQR